MRTAAAITAAAIVGLASGASAFVKPSLPRGRSMTMSSVIGSSQIAQRELEAGTTAPFGATFDPLGFSKDKSK